MGDTTTEYVNAGNTYNLPPDFFETAISNAAAEPPPTPPTPTHAEPPAPREAFAGRDDVRLLDEVLDEIDRATTAADVETLRSIVIKRMEAGDLSSLAALQLLKAANRRIETMRGLPR
jgi:hypothetical protein